METYLLSLIDEIRHTNMTATPTRAMAMSGILRTAHNLGYPDRQRLEQLEVQLYDDLISRFQRAETHEAQSAWLEALYDNVGCDNLFYNIFDDDEYELLEAKQAAVNARWHDELSAFAADNHWASLPLEERLRRLRLFFQADINTLSHGDDTLADSLFDKAARCFDQCSSELLGSGSSFSAAHLSSYYHVLTRIYPGKRNPAHTARYKRFFNLYGSLEPQSEEDLWQTRWVNLHYQYAPMHRADRYIQPRLAIIDDEACQAYRQKCFLWWADLDPDDDHSIQDKHEQDEVMNQVNSLIQSWLKAKRDGNIPIPPEKEATALLTRLCSAGMTVSEGDFFDTIIQPAYALLPRLPQSHLKTHLSVQLALYTDDSHLLEEAQSTLSTWDEATLTPEDHNLQEYLKYNQQYQQIY